MRKYGWLGRFGYIWTFSFNGMGLGLWRNRWDSRSVIWTLAFGPATLHMNVYERSEATQNKEKA